MKLLRAATLTVTDVDASVERYGAWLDYIVAERGTVPEALAKSWDAPASAGRDMAVMRPASGENVFLRFVQGDIPASYRPLRSYGWAAIEICVQDVLAVAKRMADSPFDIIGPPREIPGLDAIFPMQVQGPDGEIVYFTQIRNDLPEYDLPRADSLIDRLFILVMACSDLPASAKWMERNTSLAMGGEPMKIEYTMIANAFGLPLDSLHEIAALVHERDIFLELDQYPDEAEVRPGADGQLPPGVAVGTIGAVDIDALYAARGQEWVCAPVVRDGCVYNSKRAGVVKDLDGALIEIVEI